MEPVFSLKHIEGKKKKKKNVSHGTSIPATAYDYLKHVQHEAAHCPDVVVAEMDRSVFHVSEDANLIMEDHINVSVDENLPSREWQTEQIAAFSQIRQFLVQKKALLNKQKHIQRTKLPSPDSENQWYQFCFGTEGDVGQTLNQDIQAEDNHGSLNQKVDFNGTPALLSIICQMNQSTVLTVLDYQISWLESKPFTFFQGQWIYALLTAVEKPLLADTTFSLRTLARECAKQKENLTEEQTNERAALYLIIILVTRYFGQTDLAQSL